jgi:hypothetical protein
MVLPFPEVSIGFKSTDEEKHTLSASQFPPVFPFLNF